MCTSTFPLSGVWFRSHSQGCGSGPTLRGVVQVPLSGVWSRSQSQKTYIYILYHHTYNVRCCRLELALPLYTTAYRCSHHVCSRSRSKYPYEKMFRCRKGFLVGQYSSNTFSGDERRPKRFPLRKKANYGILCYEYYLCSLKLMC